ncbi:MAG: FHA domain-containing protein [Paraglaciecola sp.]|uniref:FHA domain-containing protein n=1 Tax=Paraglaciecola sp. TaxID=1920173 RepID=UPI0032981B4E
MKYPSEYIIGRHSSCDIVLLVNEISSKHAELVIGVDERVFLTDCGSKNGTFLLKEQEWQPVRQTYVQVNDTVSFGSFEISVSRLLDMLKQKRVSYHSADGGSKQFNSSKKMENLSQDKPIILDVDGKIKNK